MSKQKLHYYAFSFIGFNNASIIKCYTSTYVGMPYKDKITRKDVMKAKQFAGVKPDSVLISATYLGRMTEEEFIT